MRRNLLVREQGTLPDVPSSKKIFIMMENSISINTVKNLHYIIIREGH